MDRDLFDDAILHSAIDGPHLVGRAWLERRIKSILDEPSCRILLLTGDPGAGKSVVLAQLAAADPRSLRYFLRQDSMRAHRSGDAHSFLEAVGHQLAARYPDLFTSADLTVKVVQSAERVPPDGRVVGIRAEQVIASPFRQTALEVRQQLGEVAGEVSGVEIGRLVVDLRALDWRDVQHMALLGPLEALAETNPAARVLLVVDALDESADAPEGVGQWLASCPPLPPSLRVVVSSREADFLVPLRLRQAQQLRELRLDTSAAEAREDVAQYLAAALEPLNLDAVLHDSRRALASRSAAAADGNFQYAAMLVRGIQGAIDRGDNDAVRGLLLSPTIPAGLRPLYALLLTRLRAFVRPKSVPLAGGGHASAWNALYAPVLGTLAVAREPLTVADLASLSGVGLASRWVQEAVADMAQFLTERGGGYRLHHRSLSEFLTDPATERDAPGCYLEVTEWHATVGLNAGQAIHRDPDSTAAGYGLSHASGHLVAASRNGLDPARMALLVELTTDPATVEARVAQAGIDAVADDVFASAPVLGSVAPNALALGRALDRQRHALRGWVRRSSPTLFAQQVHNQAVELGEADLATALAARLEALPGPRLRTLFSVGGSPAALRRTIETGVPVHGLAAVDSNHVVAGCGDGVVRTYDAATGRLLQARTVAAGAVLAVAWSARHGVVWGSIDGRVGRWLPGSEETGELSVPGVVGAPDGPTVDPEVSLTALRRQQLTWITGRTSSVHAIAARSDGAVAIGTRQGAVLVIEPSFTEFAAGFPLHPRVVTGIDFTTSAITACGHDGTVMRTDFGSVTRLCAANCAYTGLAVTHEGRLMAARWDGGLDVVEPDGRAWTARKEGIGPATAIAVGPGDRIFVGFFNRRIWVMDGSLALRSSLRGHSEEVTCLAPLSPDTLVSGSTDGSIRVWSLDQAALAEAPQGHGGPVTALLFDQEGRLMSGSADGTVSIWDDAKGRSTGDTRSGQVWGMCSLADGTVAMATQSGRVLLASGRDLAALPGAHGGEVRAVVALADGRVVSADEFGHVIVWNKKGTKWRGREVAWVRAHKAVRAAALASGLVAIAGAAPEVSIVSADTGRETLLHGHHGDVYAVADGPRSTLLTGSQDGTARVWDTGRGECLLVYDEHRGDVSALEVVGGDLVVSGSGDRTLRVWRCSSGETVATVTLDQAVESLAVSQDGKRIAVGHGNGSVVVLAVESLPAP